MPLTLRASLTAGVLAVSPLPFVSPLFDHHMVLQRGKPNRVWGWSQPGDHVQVSVGGSSAAATADARGRWQATFPAPPEGTGYTLRVDGAQHAAFQDVAVGDVWLCGGQSNMELPLARARNGAAEVAAAGHPALRLYHVRPHAAYAPAATPEGRWQVCSPQTVAAGGGFSAVAYFFARRIQAETGVTIGVIQDCLGGTPAESWMSPATVAAEGEFARPLAEIARLRAAGAPEYGNYVQHWYDAYDRGTGGKSWAAVDCDDTHWKPVSLPGGFAALGVAAGPAVCWFRKEIVLPDPVPAGPAVVRLGVIEKMDTTFVNGGFVGASSWVENPRAYSFHSSRLHPGRNVVALRVFKLKSPGAFLSSPDQLSLTLGDGARIALADGWKGAVGVDARPPHPLPLGFENYPIMPTVLYQGMIAPVAPLALRGALWYQGEANASRAWQYRWLLPAMIGDWRRAFGQGDFPFLIVQLPAFERRKAQPGTDDWAELREAQALTAATVPQCGLAVTIDTGEADNIHPADKQPVGERLAAIALSRYYGRPRPAEGPTFAGLDREGNSLRVRFDHAAGGLVVRGGEPGEFSLAGPDRQWHWAHATVTGDTATVSAPEVPAPVAVRYAWQANPRATLFNAAGLPAAPFRSDDWPESTAAAPPW